LSGQPAGQGLAEHEPDPVAAVLAWLSMPVSTLGLIPWSWGAVRQTLVGQDAPAAGAGGFVEDDVLPA
jgi:hypothetical protein